MTAPAIPPSAPVTTLLDLTTFKDQTKLYAIVDSNNRLLGYWTLDGAFNANLGPNTVLDPAISIPNSSAAEVTAARGSRADLNTRMSVAASSYGYLNRHVVNEHAIRETRMRLRKKSLGETIQVNIGFIGDSWTNALTRYSGPTGLSLINQFGGAGLGYFSLGWLGSQTVFAGTTPPYLGGTGRISATSTDGNSVTAVASAVFTGTWTGQYNSVATADLCSTTSSTVGDNIVISVSACEALSAVKFHYIGATGASMSYSWNGGAATTVDMSTAGTNIATLTGFPTTGAAFTLTLTVVSGTPQPAGIDFQSTASGIRVNKIAGTGSSASQWATQAPTTGWRSAMTALNLNLVCILQGTNDQSGAATQATFKTNINTIITGVRAALPSVDILLIAPCENGRANTVPMSQYQDAMAQLAIEQDCAFVNLQHIFGLTYAEYGNTGTKRQWMASDLIHPNPPTGGRAIADAVTRMITQY